MKKQTALITLSILASLSCSAYAQDVQTVQTPDVVVTATRTEAQVKAVPQTVEVVTKEDIEKSGATDVYSALSLASNLDVSKAGMAGHNVMIRGMSTNHTLILIDGKRVAGEDTSVTQNVYALDRVNLSNIERIEIVRGPASVMYGSDAMGGVINIITKKAKNASTLVGVSTGTFSTNNYYHVDFGKNGKFSSTFDARFSKMKKIMEEGSAGSNFYGPVQDFNFSATYDLDANRKLDMTIGYYNEHTKANYVDSKTKTGVFYTNKDKKEWYDYRRLDYSLAYSGTSDNSNYLIRTYYSRLDKENNLYNNRASFPGPMENFLSKIYPKYDWDKSTYTLWGLEGKNTIQLNDEHLITFGGEYQTTAVEGTRMGDGGDNIHEVTQSGNGVSITKDYSKKDVNTYAGYIQDEWSPNEKWLIIPALRYDYHSSFGSEVTPKIGATYFIDEHNRLKANWGKGFKAPTISELYMNMHRSMGVANVDVYGNPDLKPERTNSWDISYEAEFGKDNNSWGKLTYFNNDISNLITSVEIQTPEEEARDIYKSKYENINKAKIDGVELELGHKLNDKWTMKLNSNWLDAINESTHERISQRPSNITRLQLNYDDNDPYGYSGILWNQWVNDFRYSNKSYSYNTFNLVVNKKFGEGNRLYAGVDNIFNKKVSDIITDGRTWRVGAEWTF